MRKWTYHYGQIMEVELQQDINGWITGFTPVKVRCAGVVFTLPIDLDITKFFDTVEEAIEGWVGRFNQQIADQYVVIRWLKNEVEKHQSEVRLLEGTAFRLAKEAVR